jgi:hypothetical protein
MTPEEALALREAYEARRREHTQAWLDAERQRPMEADDDGRGPDGGVQADRGV